MALNFPRYQRLEEAAFLLSCGFVGPLSFAAIDVKMNGDVIALLYAVKVYLITEEGKLSHTWVVSANTNINVEIG